MNEIQHSSPPALPSQLPFSPSESLPLHLPLHQPLQLPLLLHLLEIRPGQLEPLRHPRIRNPPHPGNGPQDSQIDDIPLLINRILPDPKPRPLDDGQHPRLGPRPDPALKLLRLNQLALDAEDALAHPARFHRRAGSRMQTRQRPLRRAVGRIDAGEIHRLGEMLRHHVDDALAAFDQVAQRVLGVGQAAGEADDEERRVMVDDLRVAEGR